MTELTRSAPRIVKTETEPVAHRWTEDDSILYALAVGAGQNPVEQLCFTTENSTGVRQQALPTMAVVLAPGERGLDLVEGLDRSLAVHGSQSLEVHRELPPRGELSAVTRVVGLYDKGSSALVVLETQASEPDGSPLFSSTMTVFFRGCGGWGGESGPSAPRPTRRERPADLTVDIPTRPEQALLYRLTGDRNPLHSDPVHA